MCVKVVSREVWIWEAKSQRVPGKMELLQEQKCLQAPVGAHVHKGLRPTARTLQGEHQKQVLCVASSCLLGRCCHRAVLSVTQDAVGVDRL